MSRTVIPSGVGRHGATTVKAGRAACKGRRSRPVGHELSAVRRAQVARSVDGRFGAPGHAELGEHGGHVVLDRLLGEVQTVGDLAVGQALGEQLEDLALLGAQAGDAFVLPRSVADALEDPCRDRRVEQALPGGDPANGVDEVGRPDLLQHVAGGAGHDGVEQRFVVGERREDQAGRAGVEGADLPARLDAVALFEPDVEDGHVGIEGVHATDGLLLRRGLADDRDVVLGLEQVGHAAPHDLVVVEQEHRDRHTPTQAPCVNRRKGRRSPPVAPKVPWRRGMVRPHWKQVGRNPLFTALIVASTGAGPDGATRVATTLAATVRAWWSRR